MKIYFYQNKSIFFITGFDKNHIYFSDPPLCFRSAYGMKMYSEICPGKLRPTTNAAARKSVPSSGGRGRKATCTARHTGTNSLTGVGATRPVCTPNRPIKVAFLILGIAISHKTSVSMYCMLFLCCGVVADSERLQWTRQIVPYTLSSSCEKLLSGAILKS